MSQKVRIFFLLFAIIQDEKPLTQDLMNAKYGIKIGSKLSSPDQAECEHFEERNSKFHNGILLLTQAYHIYIGVGARNLHINKAHTALDIFRIAVFFFCMNLTFSRGCERVRDKGFSASKFGNYSCLVVLLVWKVTLITRL